MAARWGRAWLRNAPPDAGQSTVEFALILPLFFGLLACCSKSRSSAATSWSYTCGAAPPSARRR